MQVHHFNGKYIQYMYMCMSTHFPASQTLNLQVMYMYIFTCRLMPKVIKGTDLHIQYHICMYMYMYLYM